MSLSITPTIQEPIFGNIDIPATIPDIGTVESMYAGARYERADLDAYEQSLFLRGELTPVVAEALEKARRVRSENRVVFYIAGGLTGVDEETKMRYGQVSDLVESLSTEQNGRIFGYVPHLHGTDPVKHPMVTSTEVRNVDYLWAVVMADFHINFLYPTAHGNAIEAGWAEAAMIPAINLNFRGNKLSRLTKGLNNRIADIEYTDTNEMLSQVSIELLKFDAWLKAFPGVDPRYYFYMNSTVLRDPVLRLHGLNPMDFNPVFKVDDFVGYVGDPQSPYYRQILKITGHLWNGDGERFCVLPNGQEVLIPDKDFTTWINPNLFN